MTKDIKKVQYVEMLPVQLYEEIDLFLKKRYGYHLEGGSIVTLEDGTVQYFVSVNTGCSATTGSLGEKLKEKFGIKEEFYLNGDRI